jgi:hypothetical protein
MPAALEIGVQLLGLLSPIIASGLGWLAVRLSQFVAAKTGSVTAATAVLKLNEIITTVVTELEQTMVAAAKARVGGGRLNQADIDAIRRAALDKIKAYLGPEGVALVARAFGLGSTDLNNFLSSKIEAAVYAIGQGVVTVPGGAVVAPAQDALPPFYASSPAHPAQVGSGALSPPATAQGIPGK